MAEVAEERGGGMFQSRTRKLGCLGIGLVVLALVVVGFMAPANLLHISLAAETLHVFGLGIPNTLLATWLTMLILITISFFATRDMEMVPSGLQNAVEAIVELFYDFVESVAGDRTRSLFPLVATFFFFIILSNWMGLMPGFNTIGVWEEHHGEAIFVPILRSASTDLNFTIALSIVSVVAAQYFGLKSLGLPYLGKFFRYGGDTTAEKAVSPFVGILELLSELIKILSFSFRLFGNMFAGEVLLIVMGFLGAFILPVPFMLLEIFVGFVQALIFAMLSLVFFMMATVHHGGDEGH